MLRNALLQAFGMTPMPAQFARHVPPPPVAREKTKFHLPIVQGEAPQISLQSMLDRYYASIDDEEEVWVPSFRLRGPRSTGVVHASDLAKDPPCQRMLAYSLYQAPKSRAKTEPRMRRIFDTGTYSHQRLELDIIAAVTMFGGTAGQEVGMPPDAKRRSGTGDCAFIMTGWPYIVEIKTIKKGGEYGFESLGMDPQEAHVDQVNTYMGLSGVRAGIVLYECKNDSEFREYFLRFDEERWAAKEAIVDEVIAHVRRGELPPKINEEQGCRMEQCSFYDSCKRRTGVRWVPPGPLEL